MSQQTDLLAQILQLETLAANAWPAAEVVALDGWRLRHTHGVTRRANSVWPNQADGATGLAEKISAVEAFYAARGLPVRYQICPAAQPVDLDAALEARGYVRVARTAVQMVELSTILVRTLPLRQQPSFAIEVAEEFNEDWFAAYCQFEEVKPQEAAGRRLIMQAIRPLVGFALLQIDDTPAAVGMGVVEGGWLGIFNMATSVQFRRRGMASAVLRTLAIWAQLYEADRAYLQVMEHNAAAQALYARVGFETLYHYHYREQGKRD